MSTRPAPPSSASLLCAVATTASHSDPKRIECLYWHSGCSSSRVAVQCKRPDARSTASSSVTAKEAPPFNDVAKAAPQSKRLSSKFNVTRQRSLEIANMYSVNIYMSIYISTSHETLLVKAVLAAGPNVDAHPASCQRSERTNVQQGKTHDRIVRNLEFGPDETERLESRALGIAHIASGAEYFQQVAVDSIRPAFRKHQSMEFGQEIGRTTTVQSANYAR
ncbi:hypothetical protein B0H19DRAFT_1067229 [Mycena capillaripes]|nr:hypothetical protein B0H19DRAFT_1067229 [Mycena capillaripes]